MKARFYFLVGTGPLVVLQLGLLLVQNLSATVSFSVTPSAVSKAFSGDITLQIAGLTPGQTVVVEKVLDANTNGLIDGADMLWQQFQLTDGQASVIGGVVNINVPGDTDSTSGAITALWDFRKVANSDVVQTFLGLNDTDYPDAHGEASLTAQTVFSLNTTEAPAPVLLLPSKTSGAQFSFLLNGVAGQNYTIQKSTSLRSQNWSVLYVTNAPSNLFPLADPSATNGKAFYRAIIIPPSPLPTPLSPRLP